MPVDWPQELYDCLMQGSEETIAAQLQDLLKRGITAEELLQVGLQGGAELAFRREEFFIPEVLMISRAMQAGIEVLRPYLKDSGRKKGTIVIGTVEGDIHDIGKNIVGAVLSSAGFDLVDLGVNIKPQQFLDATVEHKPRLVALSALLTTTMNNMKQTVEALEQSGLREDIAIIVGGAPITSEFASSIGADGYAPEAVSALKLVKGLLKTKFGENDL